MLCITRWHPTTAAFPLAQYRLYRWHALWTSAVFPNFQFVHRIAKYALEQQEHRWFLSYLVCSLAEQKCDREAQRQPDQCTYLNHTV